MGSDDYLDKRTKELEEDVATLLDAIRAIENSSYLTIGRLLKED